MKGMLFIDFLIQKDFLNTRSRQWSFLLTNQNAHLITYEPMKFRVTKVKSKFKSSANKRASCKWKRYQLWILLPSSFFKTNAQSSMKTEEIFKRFTTLWGKNFKMNVTALDRSWERHKLARFGSPRRWLRSWVAHRALWSFAGLES